MSAAAVAVSAASEVASAAVVAAPRELAVLVPVQLVRPAERLLPQPQAVAVRLLPQAVAGLRVVAAVLAEAPEPEHLLSRRSC